MNEIRIDPEHAEMWEAIGRLQESVARDQERTIKNGLRGRVELLEAREGRIDQHGERLKALENEQGETE